MRQTSKTALAITLVVAGLSGTLVQAAPAQSKPAEESMTRIEAQDFPLAQVRLLDGPFKRAMDRDTAYLLKLDPDRLLSGFRSDAGLTPKAEKYPGWESAGVAGHCLGHYLSACSMAFAATGDEQFRNRVKYVVSEMAECQRANGNGYVSAIPDGKRIFAEVARGEIRSKGFDLNGGWVPWYTMHKDMAGLRDAYLYCGNQQAVEVLAGLGDWCLKTTDALSPEQLHQMLRCEQGGMNEVSADLYAITGQAKYLELAHRFNDHQVLDPLAKGVDDLPGLHANTQIPKLIGLARQYELTGDDWARSAATFFWQDVTQNHSYVTGSNSDHEHFGPARKLADRLSDQTAETCNVYNMLKLTRHLFEWKPQAGYADFYERALFNHILASQEPLEGRVTYYVALRSGSQKEYQTQFNSFTCCVGTGMENHVKYGEAIYFHDASGLWVNQFIASELAWKDRGLVIRQETQFPEQDSTRLVLKLEKPQQMAIRIRRPYWATSGVTLKVNGQEQPVTAAPASYIEISRQWSDGDTVELTLPMSLRLETMPDDANKAAVMYGPLVLAGELGNSGELLQRVPAIVAEGRPVDQWVKPVDGKPLTFRTAGVARPQDVELIPFYQMHHQHHVVYWDLFTPDAWAKREAEYRAEQAREAALAARTLDSFQPGEMQPERDHAFDGQNTRQGDFNGKKWRDAFDGGWFSFTMKVAADKPAELACTYWGDDANGREFDVLVDGHKIASQTLNRERPGKFFEVLYPIPASLTQDKQTVTIKFQGHPGKLAGGLFAARMLRAETSAK